ncbi:MAG: cytochrome c family protein [Hyphomicrobiales bacterium]|nr:cytochrome c family protein [Hyphomicrobiales bacterium]MCP5001675.1 cytochrome c family protein [Hyphomicrobiales bacterium]
MQRTALAICALHILSPFALADDDGERLFQQCYACHSVVCGETGLPGPNLVEIVGAPIAADGQFQYSQPFKEFAESEPIWTPVLLDWFLADPEALIKGTEMGYVGLRNARDRAVLIGWLRGIRR